MSFLCQTGRLCQWSLRSTAAGRWIGNGKSSWTWLSLACMPGFGWTLLHQGGFCCPTFSILGGERHPADVLLKSWALAHLSDWERTKHVLAEYLLRQRLSLQDNTHTHICIYIYMDPMATMCATTGSTKKYIILVWRCSAKLLFARRGCQRRERPMTISQLWRSSSSITLRCHCLLRRAQRCDFGWKDRNEASTSFSMTMGKVFAEVAAMQFQETSTFGNCHRGLKVVLRWQTQGIWMLMAFLNVQIHAFCIFQCVVWVGWLASIKPWGSFLTNGWER